jgi:curli biogenesis system outer membrane secretion channel CsgG
MSRFPRTLLLSALALLAAVRPLAAADAAKPRVAVIEFKNKVSGWSWGWYHAGTQAQDMFVTELVGTKKYRVIEREQLQAIMQEKHLSLSGDIDPKTAIQFGKLLGVEYLITGALTELGAQRTNVHVPGGLLGRFQPSTSVGTSKMDCAIDARAISTTTGEIVWADKASESSSDAKVYVAGAGGGVDDQQKLDHLIRPVVAKLAASLAKEALGTAGLGGAGDASGIVGKIAKVDGGTLYVNVGSEAGVKEGNEFNVTRTGEQIKDPDTGEVLGANETKVGRVKITSVKGPRLSIASPVSGSGFKAGDTLKN